MDRRTFGRAVAAMAIAAIRKTNVSRVAGELFEDDEFVPKMIKAVSNPATRSTFWQAVASKVLPALVPASAAGRLMALGNTVVLDGVYQVAIPRISQAGRPATVFVAEGGPFPVVNCSSSSYLLGPTKKIGVISTISHELEWASADTAAQIVAEALEISAIESLDATMFSATAASAAAPAGILNGLTAIPSVGTGAVGVADDLAKIAKAISNAGVNPDDMVIITSAQNAMKIKVLASPKLTNEVLTGFKIPDDWVIGVAPQAFWTAFPDADVSVEISANASGLAHFDDSAPAQDPLTGAPTRSLYQQDWSGSNSGPRRLGRSTAAASPTSPAPIGEFFA
jgi:hypothetical protein